ncbi:hypothetical protein RDABS01_009908 [Bienertia sinuspersici]
MHIGSSTTTFSRDTYIKKVVKPPDHVQQERIRLTTQLHHQKQEGGGQAAYMHNKVVSKLGTSQTVQSHAKHDFPLRLMVGQLMLNANGKLQFVSGSIQPIDILSNNGVKYYVEFNEFHQPIRKGGHILVKFLGYIAKMVHYCPIGAITWHDVEKNLKVQIVNKMREHFIIPDDEVYDTLAQQRVGKCWRHYKHELKKTFFQLDKNLMINTMILCQVDILKLFQIGKEARSLQCQVHTMVSNRSRTWKKMGLVEAWERSHMRKDGSFVEGTTLEDFLDDAKATVETLKLANSSCSSVDVEDEAFHDLMNGGDIPERPQGFGFGVKKSDVYGVRGLLRKEGSKKVKTRCIDFDVNVKKNEVLEKENRELSRKNDEYTKTLKVVVTQFSQILDVVCNGKASVQLIDATQSALHMAIPEGGRKAD